jgi:predicted ferric reductase
MGRPPLRARASASASASASVRGLLCLLGGAAATATATASNANVNASYAATSAAALSPALSPALEFTDDAVEHDHEVNSGDDGLPPPAAADRIKLCNGHPDIDDMLRRGGPAYSFPSTHPVIHPQLSPYSGGHPDMDRLLQRGEKYEDSDHPRMAPYVNYLAAGEACWTYDDYQEAVGCPVNVTVNHISVDSAIAAGQPFPSWHPKVHALLAAWMSPGHRDIDVLLAAGTKLPVGHPPVDDYLCMNQPGYRSPDEGCVAAANVSSFHPSVDDSIARGEALPGDHPLVDHLLRAAMPEGHGDIDGYLADGTELPLGHPYVDTYICFTGGGGSGCTEVFYGHPETDSKLRNGEQLPGGHPTVHDLFSEYLPDAHGNCDDYIRDRTPIPDWHPNIDDYICERTVISAGIILSVCMAAIFVLFVLGRCCGSYLAADAVVVAAAKGRKNEKNNGAGAGAGAKKKYDKVPSDNQPIKRKKSKEQQVLPVDPALYKQVGQLLGDEHAAAAPPAGALLAMASAPAAEGAAGEEGGEGGKELEMSALDGSGGILRVQSYDGDGPCPQADEAGAGDSQQPSELMVGISRLRSGSGYGSGSSMGSPLPRRNMQLHTMKALNSQHSNPELFPFDDYRDMPVPTSPGLVVPPDQPKVRLMDGKMSSLRARCFVVLHNTRVPYFDWTLGNVLTVLAYLAINLLCLFLAPEKDLGRGWGSLAVANTMLLVVPACRNSILSMGLNIPFDRIVYLHRFLGRFALFCVLVHGYYYIGVYYTDRYAFVTGVAGLACCSVIFLTSLNFFRREHFNLFFWSHYSFVAYMALVYVHVEQTKPFILAAAALYLVDKLLRCVWMLWPHRTLQFRARTEVVAQVRFPKNPLTRMLGFHNVGQYYFVNFPALSLSEWHPFSVSSGPREDSVELHIRDLGDHTARIVQLAKEKEKANAHTWVLIDGPYGNQSFNYRCYGTILLAAGGIGVTPLIGMLKDIYDVEVPEDQRRAAAPHGIETIYLLW